MCSALPPDRTEGGTCGRRAPRLHAVTPVIVPTWSGPVMGPRRTATCLARAPPGTPGIGGWPADRRVTNGRRSLEIGVQIAVFVASVLGTMLLPEPRRTAAPKDSPKATESGMTRAPRIAVALTVLQVGTAGVRWAGRGAPLRGASSARGPRRCSWPSSEWCGTAKPPTPRIQSPLAKDPRWGSERGRF